MNPAKSTGFDAPFLDDEEKQLIEQAEQNALSSDLSVEEANAKWKAAIEATSRRRPVTIRLQARDIDRIKRIASRKGMPYQTLISSVIHRYATGELKSAD